MRVVQVTTSKQRKECANLVLEANLARELEYFEEDVLYALYIGKILIASVKLDFYKNYGIIKQLVVKKGYKRQGLGSVLVKKALQHFSKENCDYVALCCKFYYFKFYRTFGFDTVKRKELPFSIRIYPQFVDPHYSKCAVMRKKL